MLNYSRADLADRQIRQIEKELRNNEIKMRNDIEKAEFLESQFPEKQRKISELEHQLRILQESNQDPKRTVTELTKRKESLISQNNILKQLLRQIQRRIKENGDSPAIELTDSQKQQISERLEIFFNNLDEEFQSFDVQILLDELKQVKEQRKKIEDEISILKQVSGDWNPDDDLDIVLENYSNYAYSPEDNQEEFQLFHVNQFNPQDPSILETSVDQNIYETKSSIFNQTKETQNKLEWEIEKMKTQNDRNMKIFNEQEQFLSTLEKLTKQYLTNQNSKQHYENIENTIDKIIKDQENDQASNDDSHSDELRPLEIPDITNYNEETVDPIAAIANDFEAFSQDLLKDLPKTTLFEDVVRETEEKFVVPEYVPPQPPVVEKVVTASKDLANLTKTLEQMKEIASAELPQIPEFKHEAKESQKETNSYEEIQFPDLPEQNNDNLNNLLHLVKQKLPEQFVKNLPDSVEEISHTNENIEEEDEEEEIVEINPSKEILDKINEYHKTLESLSTLEFPEDPNLSRPQQVPEAIVRVEKLDKDTILNSVEQFLSPNQQNAEHIERECLILSKNIEKVKQKIAQLNEDETDLVSDDEVAIYRSRYELICKQYEELDNQVQQNMQHLRDLKKENNEKQKEKSDLQQQLESLPMKNKTITELEDMVAKEKERLAELRKQGNQEIEDYRKMMSRKK